MLFVNWPRVINVHKLEKYIDTFYIAMCYHSAHKCDI